MAKRIRDYAKERAQRDTKYRKLIGASYNEYDAGRRKRKAILDTAHLGQDFNRYEKSRRESIEPRKQAAQDLIDRTMRHYEETGHTMEDLEHDLEDSDYWSNFRAMYDKGIAA